LEGFAPGLIWKDRWKHWRQMKQLQFMVIEFDPIESALYCRIPVSGAAKTDEKEAARKEAKVMQTDSQAVKNIQSKVEKPTLGDLGALAEIKEKLKQKKGDDAEKTEHDFLSVKGY